MAKDLKAFLTKKYEKTGAIHILDEIQYIDTGIPSLNYVISGRPLTGGIPLSGKMTIMYGPDGAGKTSLINHTIAQAQKKNIDIVYIDTERSITKPRLRQFGVDLDKLSYATPEYIEEVFEVIEDVCSFRLAERDEKPTLIIWDSIAGTPAKQTLERGADEVEIAADAKAITRGLKRIRGKVKNSNVGLLLVNQARVNMDSYGDTFIMPGGYSLKHMVDLVLRVNKLKVGKRTDGQNIKFSTPGKNRLFRPFQSTDIFFDFDQCFTRENIITAFVDFLVTIGMIGQSGAWCYSLAEADKLMTEHKKDSSYTEDMAIKDCKKFYKKDYVETLINDDKEYQNLLKTSEDYIQKNINVVAEKSKDATIEEEEKRSLAAEKKHASKEELEAIEED